MILTKRHYLLLGGSVLLAVALGVLQKARSMSTDNRAGISKKNLLAMRRNRASRE